MPRDAIAISELSLNAGTALTSGTAINTSNNASIDAGGDTRKLFLRVTNTAGASKNVTVKAGDNPPSVLASIGDLTVAVAAGGDQLISLESARFTQDDGCIYVDFASGHTGGISAWRLPSNL